jgi:hypothetical protein
LCTKICDKVFNFNLKTVCTNFGAYYAFAEPDLEKIVENEVKRRGEELTN